MGIPRPGVLRGPWTVTGPKAIRGQGRSLPQDRVALLLANPMGKRKTLMFWEWLNLVAEPVRAARAAQVTRGRDLQAAWMMDRKAAAADHAPLPQAVMDIIIPEPAETSDIMRAAYLHTSGVDIDTDEAAFQNSGDAAIAQQEKRREILRCAVLRELRARGGDLVEAVRAAQATMKDGRHRGSRSANRVNRDVNMVPIDDWVDPVAAPGSPEGLAAAEAGAATPCPAASPPPVVAEPMVVTMAASGDAIANQVLAGVLGEDVVRDRRGPDAPAHGDEAVRGDRGRRADDAIVQGTLFEVEPPSTDPIAVAVVEALTAQSPAPRPAQPAVAKSA